MSKYTLEKSEKRNVFIVRIVADSNDADYVTTENIYSKESFEKYVLDGLIELLKNHGDNHKLPDFPNDKYDLDLPYNGWNGTCHSLESVTVEYFDENGDQWNVKLNTDGVVE